MKGKSDRELAIAFLKNQRRIMLGLGFGFGSMAAVCRATVFSMNALAVNQLTQQKRILEESETISRIP